MTSYSIACGIQVNDNDHFQIAHFRLPNPNIPQFIVGIRGLLTYNLKMLHLFDIKQKAVITGNHGVSFQVLFDNGCSAYLCEKNLYDMESFALCHMFEKIKPKYPLSMQLKGDEDAQMNLNFWIEQHQ